MLVALAGLALSERPSLVAQTPEAPEVRLLGLHAQLLRAHRDGDVDLWMSMEADTLVSANAGRISFPSRDERRDARAGYLESTMFEAYRDVRPPVVRVSEDGTLGWVIAEVEVRGRRTLADGSEAEVDEVWAWVELYAHGPDGWRLVGNVSNRRPGGPEHP